MFDQAWCEYGSTVTENCRRKSMKTISLQRIRARVSIENITAKNFYMRLESDGEGGISPESSNVEFLTSV